MNDFDEFDFVPLSIIMASGERLLAYGVPAEDEEGRILLRGVLQYNINTSGNINLFDYDPASDDTYIVFNMADIIAINSMSERFRSIYMDYHDKMQVFDLSDLSEPQKTSVEWLRVNGLQ